MTLDRSAGGIGADPGLVVLCFSIASLTAPTSGVLLGGWIVDKMGGYADESGEAAARTMKICSVFGMCSFTFAVPAAFSTEYWTINACLWFVLFFGGGLVSPATGVCINAVNPDLRSFASALSMLMFNLLGYAAAPFLCGVIAQLVDLRWGFRTVVLAAGMPLITTIVAWRVAEGLVEADKDSEKLEAGETKGMKLANPLAEDDDGDDDDGDKSEQDDADLG